jgi:threonine dehydrogenase-like Zn-dependent dehydrogenase
MLTIAIHSKILLVTGTAGGAPRDYEVSVKTIDSGGVDVRRVVSHPYPFNDLAQADEMSAHGTAIEVVIAARP